MTDRDPGQNRGARDAPSALVAITAGAALFNERRFRAARDVWEGERRPRDDGGNDTDRDDGGNDTDRDDGGNDTDRDDGGDTPDDVERLLRGLAATAAATHRAADGDRSGAAERAADAVAALASVSDARGVALSPVREWAERLVSAPEKADAATAPRVRIGDETPEFDDLSLAAAGVAAPALARGGEPGDPEVLAAAADFAREERGTGRTEFAELLFAYLRTPDARPQVAARLGDHVDREARKRRDVDGLF